MKVLGYILLVLNLAAGGAFAYLAVQDWEKRQTITATGLAQYVRLQGVPLDDTPASPESPDQIPFPVEMAGGYVTSTVGQPFLKKLFTDAQGGDKLGGEPAASQLGEVKRVKAKVQSLVDGADGDAARSKVLFDFLKNGAETYEERTALQKLAAANDAKGLQDRLNAAFDRVLKPKIDGKNLSTSLAAGADPAAAKEATDKAATATKDDTERRARVAHLLTQLDVSSPDWQTRVARVVGLRRYVKAVAAQTGRWAEMAGRVDRLMEQDQVEFAAEYALLKRLAIERTQMVRDSAEVKKGLQEQVVLDKEFVGRRQTELKTIQDRVKATRDAEDVLLREQKGLETRLFAAQQEVGQTLDAIFAMEQQLEARERSALPGGGAAPKAEPKPPEVTPAPKN